MTPPSTEWSNLLAAWQSGQNIRSALDAIQWDAPVITWVQAKKEPPVALLAHPMAVLFSLGDAELSAKVAEQLVKRKWESQASTLESPPVTLSSPRIEIPLPAMNNLWQWGVLPAALEARAWEAAKVVLPRVAACNQQESYTGVSANALCEQLSKIQEELPFFELWNTLVHCPDFPDRRFLAGLMFTNLATKGNPALAGAFINRENTGFVQAAALACLVDRGHPQIALQAAEHMQNRNALPNSEGPLLDPWLFALDSLLEGPFKDRSASHIAWLTKTQPHCLGALNQSSPGDYQKSWAVIARAVLACPGAFEEQIQASMGPNPSIIVEWARHVPPTDPRIAPWVDRFVGSSVPFSPEVLLIQICELPKSSTEQNSYGSRASGLETMVDRVAFWGYALSPETVRTFVHSSFREYKPPHGPSPEWSEALAEHDARRLEGVFPAMEPKRPGVRM